MHFLNGFDSLLIAFVIDLIVNAESVAAPSSTDKLAIAVSVKFLKKFLSSDLGVEAEKYGCANKSVKMPSCTCPFDARKPSLS